MKAFRLPPLQVLEKSQKTPTETKSKAKMKKKEKPKALDEALVKSDPELARVAEEKK